MTHFVLGRWCCAEFSQRREARALVSEDGFIEVASVLAAD
jgi:hypothetical protein